MSSANILPLNMKHSISIELKRIEAFDECFAVIMKFSSGLIENLRQLLLLLLNLLFFFLSYSQHDRKINNDFVISQDIVAVAVEHFVIFLPFSILNEHFTFCNHSAAELYISTWISTNFGVLWIWLYLYQNECVLICVCECRCVFAQNLIAHRFHFPS